MSDSHGVATTRRRLRMELRRLREAAGLHQAEVVKHLDWSISKLIRIENGSVGISVTDVRALAAIYGAEPATVEELVKLARVTRERQWWSSYRHVLSQGYREYIGYEADATAIHHAHPTAIPGLLQTEDYIRAANAATALGGLSEERAEAEFEIRRRRQREILFSDSPPTYRVIIDESALRRQVGGAKVMRGQLEHLLALPEHLVTLAVIPFEAGAHLAMQGPFTIMDFANEEDASVLFLETLADNPVQRDQGLVAQYREEFDRMLDRSYQGAEAKALIRTIAEGMELDPARPA